MTRSFRTQTAALIATCGLAATCALAQPTPDAVVSVTSAGVQVAPELSVAAGQVRWIRIDLSSAANQLTANWLDIIGGNTAGVDFDTEYFLFNNAGAFIATDDDSGPAAHSRLSFGGGCGAPARTSPAGEGSPPLAAGLSRSGGNGNLAAGTYWLAIAGFDSSQTTAPWGVTTSSTLSGTVNATFAFGASGTAATPPSALNLGTLSNPSTVTDLQNFAGPNIRWYQLTIPAVGAAAGNSYLDISTNLPASGGTNRDNFIALYNSDGLRVASDDQDGPGSWAALTFGLATPTRPAQAPVAGASAGLAHNGRDGAALPAGTYYLAVAYWVATANANCFNFTSTSTVVATDTLTTIQLGNFSSLPPTGTAGTLPSVNNCGSATSTLSVTVTPGTNPTSTGIAVTADLTAIGGSSTQALLDDGVAPDAAAGDNIFTFVAPIANTVTAGAKTINYTINDAQARSSTTSNTLTVTNCPPANDECANATVIPSSATTFPFNANGSTASTGFTYCTGFGGDVFFRWTAPGSGTTTINTCGANGGTGDTVLAVFASCAGGASIACNDEADTGPCVDSSQSIVTFNAVEGTEYIIAVKNYFSGAASATSGNLNITAPTGVSVEASIDSATGNNCGDDNIVISAVFTPAPNSTGITATADLTSLGGPSAFALLDDGVAPDAAAGDNTFTANYVIPNTVTTGAKTISVAASDAQGRTAGDTASITIGTCPPAAPACPAGTVAITATNLNSGGSLTGGNFANGSASATVSGSGINADTIRISGLVQEANLATWASELRLRVTTPSGAFYDFQPSPVAGTAGTAAERGFDEPTTGAGFRSFASLELPITAEPADGVWTVLAYEGPEVPTSTVFDDAGLDATWLNVCVTIAGAPGLPQCGSIDFNNDGLFPDDNDLVQFLSVLAGGPCDNDPNCGTIDFNGDGLFPDDNDLVDFLTVLAGGTPTNCTP